MQMMGADDGACIEVCSVDPCLVVEDALLDPRFAQNRLVSPTSVPQVSQECPKSVPSDCPPVRGRLSGGGGPSYPFLRRGAPLHFRQLHHGLLVSESPL